MESYELTDKIKYLKNMARTGGLNYESAKKMAEPLLEELNLRMEKIAKKYHKKHYKVTFIKF
jgi:hypothetical protein